MKFLYLILNIGTISIPFIYSFNKKLDFKAYWKPLFSAIFITSFIFILWDIFFTQNEIWGFNDDYLLGLNLINLPIEEWLFFICIPYACVFTYYAFNFYLPQIKPSIKFSNLISIFLLVLFLCIASFNFNKLYTFVNFSLASVLMVISIIKYKVILQKFYIPFLILLIPFFIVNGILTGSFITQEVVWYNNAENLNIRLFTIPIEDTVYAFSLILMNLILIDVFNSRLKNYNTLD